MLEFSRGAVVTAGACGRVIGMELPLFARGCEFGHHPFDFFKGQVGQPLSAILGQGLRA